MHYWKSAFYLIPLALLAAGTFWLKLFSLNYFYFISLIHILVIMLYPKIKGYSFQVFTFLLAVCSGMYGFSTQTHQDYPISNALYSTFRLFVLDTDQVFSEAGTKFVEYPPSIEVARWAAAAYIISTILQLLLGYFGHSLKTTWLRLSGNHIVVLGLNEKTIVLVRDLLAKRRKVLIIQDHDHPDLSELKSKGAHILRGNPLDTALYRKASIRKADYILSLHDEDAANLNIIQAIYNYVSDKGSNKKIPIYTQQNHTITQPLFDSTEKAVSEGERSSLEIHPVTLQSLIARQLLDEHPIYRHYEEQAKDPNGKPFHLLFIGFGLTGQQIAIQAIQRAHFYNKNPLHITVVDQHAHRVDRHWKENNPRLQDAAKINFLQQDIEMEDIGALIKQSSPEVTHVYICLDTDEQDALQGIRLHGQIKDIPIFVKLQQEHHFANWLHKEESLPRLYRFGSWEDVLTEEMVINENLDRLAKKVHKLYEDTNPKAHPWDKLPVFTKNSNRAQVDHLDTKLFLMGLTRDVDKATFEETAASHIEPMAEVEHRRWNAFHFINGWDTLPLAEVHKGHDRVKDKKLHACLVTWRDLDAVSAKSETDFKKKDREAVHGIINLINGKSNTEDE